tara:strand:- start:1958 stop:2893 length:936 start_codon:yes stop_codon:yes gene_type:complete
MAGTSSLLVMPESLTGKAITYLAIFGIPGICKFSFYHQSGCDLMPENSIINSDSSFWVTPLQAVHLLSPQLGGDKAAKKAIIERLLDSAVETRAAWFAFGVDLGEPYVPAVYTYELEDGEIPLVPPSSREMAALSKPKVSATRFGSGFALSVEKVDIIGGVFWGAAKKKDIKRWNWREGLLLVTLPAGSWADEAVPHSMSQKFDMRMFVLGAEFKKADIEKIVSFPSSPVTTVNTGAAPEKRGRKLSDGWPDWVAEVVLMHHEGKLERLTATKLIATIDERLASAGKKAPGLTTVRTTANAVVAAINSVKP